MVPVTEKVQLVRVFLASLECEEKELRNRPLLPGAARHRKNIN